MDSQHPREHNFRLNASPAVDAPWQAPAFPTLQHQQSVPSESSHRLPDPRQLHGVGWDGRFPAVDAVGNQAREDMPSPVENTVARGQPQDPRYNDMGYYDTVYDYRPLHGHHDGIADIVGVAQEDDPTEAQVNPPAHDINTFDDAGQHAAPGLDEWPHQDPVPNGSAAVYLQRIAIHYLHQPDLQVSLIHAEPSHHAGGVQVVITLETTHF